MKSLISLSRVMVFAACALWFLAQMPSLRAQLQSCPKYNTENNVPLCNDCCTSSGGQSINWTDGTTNGNGIQTLSTMYPNCGSPTNSCSGGTQSTACSSTSNTWYQAVDDPAECCIPAGTACNQGTCCADLVYLSNNTCGNCRSDGASCGSDSDCCDGTCSDGVCASQDCSLGGDPCEDDSDCCSGYCDPEVSFCS